MDLTKYKTKDDVVKAAEVILHKTIRQLIPKEALPIVEEKLSRYGTDRKGYLGDLVEEYVFGIPNNGRAEADFVIAGVELKTTPLKRHNKKEYVAKERLVFSMIDYDKVITEKWETSSFLKKNQLLLLMFYLYELDKNLIDREFKFIHLLNLLQDVSVQDVEQIKKDWEFIIAKIKRGEAHLLSEGDTYYLGACTKAKDGRVVRDQPASRIPAKPRAFSFKQSYLTFLIQKHLLKKDVEADSIYRKQDRSKTIKEVVHEKFEKYIGKTDKEILSLLNWNSVAGPKNIKRLIANRILTGTGSNHIEELEKANINLRVINLEPTGTLKESISFPAFAYKDLVGQVWYDEKEERMADFHAALEMDKFLFVVFQKIKGRDEAILKEVKFWNFPIKDLPEAERVFQKTVRCIEEGKYDELPKSTESLVAHVRPHGRNAKDTQETPQGTQETKRCFWLNAKYIQNELEKN